MFSVLSNLTMMATGFAQGLIALFKGDVLKDRYLGVFKLI